MAPGSRFAEQIRSLVLAPRSRLLVAAALTLPVAGALAAAPPPPFGGLWFGWVAASAPPSGGAGSGATAADSRSSISESASSRERSSWSVRLSRRSSGNDAAWTGTE